MIYRFTHSTCSLKVFAKTGPCSTRGHQEVEGNLHQLLLVWSKDNVSLQQCLRNNKYMSPLVINELIILLGSTLIRNILERINLNSPSWYSIIADEATDVVNREQLNRCLLSG